MAMFRIGEVAALLRVSSDTVRRWVDAGRLPASRDKDGARLVDGVDLAALARDRAVAEQAEGSPVSSGRTWLHGIVTDVRRDTVMAQVEITAGPYRVVSLMSREAADELNLQVGVLAVAVIKSTNVVVEVS